MCPTNPPITTNNSFQNLDEVTNEEQVDPHETNLENYENATTISNVQHINNEKNNGKLIYIPLEDKNNEGRANNFVPRAGNLINIDSPISDLELHDIVVQQITEVIDKGGISPRGTKTQNKITKKTANVPLTRGRGKKKSKTPNNCFLMNSSISCNIRGVKSKGAFTRLNKLVKKHRASFIALQEPFVDEKIGIL